MHPFLICTMLELKSPIHEVPRGFRLVAAIPNMAAVVPFKVGGPRCPSFKKPYLVAIVGDFPKVEQAIAMQKRFELGLKHHPIVRAQRVKWVESGKAVDNEFNLLTKEEVERVRSYS